MTHSKSSKAVSLLATVAALGGSTAFAASKAADYKTDAAKASYIMGHQTVTNFKKNGADVDVDAFVNGMKDSQKGTESVFSPAETQKVMEDFQKQVQTKRAALQEKEGKANKADGVKFLETNKSKPGVKVTASGLQYKVIKEGNGPKPSASDTVTTHYKGTLIGGKVFDSSYDRGEPASFPVGGVIKGWTEALQLMPVGSKWELYIPSDLAYGSRGAGADIGPDATLVFEVELIAIKGKEEAPKGDSAAKSPSAAKPKEEPKK
jgi:FKBP-type peptidyl-prolyl cis-trans isomerase FklB